MSDKPSGLSLGDIISAAGFVLALLTAWLYVAGWTYAYHYFDRLRIPLLMAELPREHYFVYGGLVVWKNIWWALVVGAFVGGLAWTCTHFAGRLRRFGISAILVVAVVCLFVLARIGGTHTAGADFLKQRGTDYSAYPRVRFQLAGPDTERLAATLADLADTDCGRLVLLSNERMFLIRPIENAASAALDTFVVPWTAVEALRIRADYSSCP